MFKFSKLIVLAFMIFSLVACSSTANSKPEDVRDEIWNTYNKVYDEIYSFYKNDKTLNVSVLQEHGEVYKRFVRGNDITVTSSEKFLLDHFSNLATYAVMINEGTSAESLKNAFNYDYELELKIAKELLNR